jgi:REP-associated tyrosine transposase
MARRDSQLRFQVQSSPRWGGRRAGAGRKPGPNPGLPHASRDSFAKTLPTHVTLRIRDDAPSLRSVKIVRAVEKTFARGCERPGFRLVHYSLQGNHAHLIVEAQGPEALGRGMMAIGSRLARAVNRVTGRTGPVLADRYHHRVLSTPREVRSALQYVLLNARRHTETEGRAAARQVRLDPASSAHWFDGWKHRDTLDDRHLWTKRPVARARTWLLTLGWRQHGLLDPNDVPGKTPVEILRAVRRRGLATHGKRSR